MRDDYRLFLMAPLVFTRLLLDEIDHLIELPFDWLCDISFSLFKCDLILAFLLQQFETGNRWIETLDYHPCITSEPTNQVC